MDRRTYLVIEHFRNGEAAPTADRALLEQWVDCWRDLVDFEVHEVLGSAEAAERILARDAER